MMDRNAIRDAKLKGIRAAAEAHAKLGLIEKIRRGAEQVDVFGSIHELGIAILCKPLEGLLGAYLCMPDQEIQGIIVTTNSRLPIQRFTAAHEFGHYWLKHDESLDSEDSIMLARQGVSNIPIQEIEAEAFASEFLLPKYLMIKTSKKLDWNKSDLKNPDIVYQLSLRTGTSYEATRFALLDNKIIDFNTAKMLGKIQPKITKKKALRAEALEDPWSDVFLLTSEDSGSTIQASPEDTVVIELPEHSSSGYLWSEIASDPAVEVINDETIKISGDSIGNINKRRLSVRGDTNTNIHIEERRPWEKNSTPLEIFDVSINYEGKEQGLPRAARA